MYIGKDGLGMLYISAWGFFVVRSDELGNARASIRGTSNRQCLHVFFVYVGINSNQNFRRLNRREIEEAEKGKYVLEKEK